MRARNGSMAFSYLSSAYPWLIVFCGMLFYCFNYFLRISPSVMQADLSQAFHITATQFGALAGFYYLAYTPMQVPAGMIYDKFGARLVLCGALLAAILGLSIFISAETYQIAGAGRLLIGLGCAFAYIGTLKLASIWLPPDRFATVAGLTTAVGMVSGALSQKYLTHVIANIGYQEALRTALITGVVLCVAIFFLVRNRPKVTDPKAEDLMHTPVNMQQLMTSLWMISRNRQMWLIGIIGCLLYLPSSVFLDLWGIPYLKAVYHFTQEDAVAVSSYTFYGWIISGPIIGYISDKIQRRVYPLTFTGFFAAALLCIVFYVPNLNPGWFSYIFFMIGFCCGAHPICFALGKESNPIQISGTSVAVTNMLIMIGGMIFQPVVGKLLDFHTNGTLGADGLPVYSSTDYTFALSVVPLGVALGILLSFFLKETYCQSQATAEEEAIFQKPLRLAPELESELEPEAEGAN